MAWFKKTLEDMKKAIEAKDWDEVDRILQEHHSGERNTHSLVSDMKSYGERLSKIDEAFARAKSDTPGASSNMLEYLTWAMAVVERIEKEIQRLVAEGKFLE